MSQSEIILSSKNPKLQALQKLQVKKERASTGLFVAEGEDMLTEALASGKVPAELYCADGFELDPEAQSKLGGCAVRTVSKEALDKVSVLGSGSRIIGVWQQFEYRLDEIESYSTVAYLHSLYDPSNVGAILRSADALSSSLVVLGEGSADPFGPKTVRTSMGSIFRQPFVRASWSELAQRAAEWQKVALVPRAEATIGELEMGQKALILLGSEREGLPEQVLNDVDVCASIPQRDGGAESLNVSVAAGIALYEIQKRRIGSNGE